MALFSRWFRSPSTPIRNIPVRPGFRPAVEYLESRLAPATFVVSLTSDTGPTNSTLIPLGPGTSGDLRNAIFQADQTPGTQNVIDLTGVSGTIALKAMLPPIFTTGGGSLLIVGPGAANLTISGNDGVGANVRPFFIVQGTVGIANLTIANGLAQGGKGGAGMNGGGGGGAGLGGGLLIDGTTGATIVTLTNVSFNANQAIGGSGGNLSGTASFGGGGGAGGNGGSGTGLSGGGGGFLGNGGNATSGERGGGGGFTGMGGTGGGNGGAIGGGGGGGGMGNTGGGNGAPSLNQAGGGGGSSGFVGSSAGANATVGVGNGGNGGKGGFGGGGGSGGGSGGGVQNSAGAGGDYGGGGGAGGSGTAGAGGFGGGGGAAFLGGAGGFGGGGGGGVCYSTGGAFGGNGGAAFDGGGGGGLGGALFQRAGTLYLINTSFINNTATGGAAGGAYAKAGQGVGGAVFIYSASEGGTATAESLGAAPTFSGNTAGTSSPDFAGTLTTDAGATLTATAGTPQSTDINTSFPTPLQATLQTGGGTPVPVAALTFTAPGAGASATLSSAVTLANGSLLFETNASGQASVTATANGTVGAYTVTAGGGVLSPTFSLTNNADPMLGALAPTQWTINQAGYTGAIPIGNGTGPFTVSAQSNLPPGLTATVVGASTDVTFTGTPNTAGIFNNVQITVQDASGTTVGGTFSITINPAVVVGSLSLTQGTIGQPYTGTIAVRGGTGAYSHLVVTGLPGGLSASLSGSTITLSGTPPVSGPFSLTVSIQDSIGATGNATAPLTISGPPTPPPTPSVTPLFAVGSDAGIPAEVKVYNATTGALVLDLLPFGSFTGGARVAVVAINGTPDIIVGAGPGGGPQVNVYNGNTGQLLAAFYGLSPAFTGGVFVAAASSSSGQNWIAVSAGAGGGPQVVVYAAKAVLTAVATGTAPSPLTSFYAFAPTFSGGVTVALGDVTGGGKLDVIAGAGPGGGSQVIVVDGTKFGAIPNTGLLPSGALLASFFAFNPAFKGGVFVSGGVASGTEFNLIVGAGPSNGLTDVRTAASDIGPGPQVLLINGALLAQVQSNGQIASSAVLDTITAFSSAFNGGVRVGFSPVFGSNGKAAILTAAGPGGGPQVAPFDGATFQSLSNFFALAPGFSGGLFIAG